MVHQAVVQIQSSMGTAVKTLLEIMEDNEAPASARVTASKTIIDQSNKAIEVENLEARIHQIEQAMKEKLSCKN